MTVSAPIKRSISRGGDPSTQGFGGLRRKGTNATRGMEALTKLVIDGSHSGLHDVELGLDLILDGLEHRKSQPAAPKKRPWALLLWRAPWGGAGGMIGETSEFATSRVAAA